MHDRVHHVLSKVYPGRVLVSSDAQIVILDAQISSECVNLNAQIVILDAQNQSKQVDFESCFQI